MSIYIKGMDMPKRCAECTFETLFSDDMHYCIVEEILTEDYRDYRGCRPPLCPLVEVKTPHGDLVDHEALGEILLRMRNDDTLTFVEDDEFRKSLLDDVIHETWNGLRTIIEAEGE